VNFDPSVLGRRLRHYRRLRGMTLDELGALVGRPAPYLSLVENGRREPKPAQITELAAALGVSTDDLLDPSPPNRRARLELAVERAQADPRYAALGLPYLKPGFRVPDVALEHVAALFDQVTTAAADDSTVAVRRAAVELAADVRQRDGYLQEIETVAGDVLRRTDYGSSGPLTTRHVTDIVGGFGYRLRAVDDIPPSVRSIIDDEQHCIYIAQRDELSTRQARKAVLQTIGSIALGHGEPLSAAELLRQRLESAYFAAAVLVPERAAVTLLTAARAERDLSVEDLKEHFYVSHEMAAQRFTNLATVRLGIPTHFLRTDTEGRIWKAFENDGIPLPGGDGGDGAETVEGRILCRAFGARQAFSSLDRYAVHHQYTDTPAGTFWCATHIATDHAGHAFTVGVRFDDARLFRGRTTPNHRVSSCPGGSCCAVPTGSAVRTFPRLQERLVTLLAPGLAPAVDAAAVAEVAARHRDADGETVTL